MQFGRSDLADLNYFLVIAKYRSFRKASIELGVGSSALSHSLKSLEERLGVRLINRTTRSVTLTEAGEELRSAIDHPFEMISEACEVLNKFRDTPSGHLRLNVANDAGVLLLAPVLPVFIERYPDVEVEITSTNRMVDMVDAGYDAGIRYGGSVPDDMIIQKLSADIRWAVAGSPNYLMRYGLPEHPRDLLRQQCLKVRLGDERIYRWEFLENGVEFDLSVPGMITIDETQIGLALAKAGAGLMFAAEPVLQPLVASGELNFVLEDWFTYGPGFYMYYSSRRQVPIGLRLLIDLIREIRPLGF